MSSTAWTLDMGIKLDSGRKLDEPILPVKLVAAAVGRERRVIGIRETRIAAVGRETRVK